MSAAIQPGLADREARRLIREEIGLSLFVEASAGTGKTTELVRRIVRVLAAGATTIDRIAAVTFTHKAAGELKLRLRQGLDQARSAAPAAELLNLEEALARLEEASIGTIHSFCAQILRQRPVEARVDPAFGEATEYESARLFDRVFREWLQDALNRSLPGVRRALVRAARPDAGDDESPAGELQRAAWSLIEWRDFPAPWRRPGFDRHGQLNSLAGRMLELADWSGRSSNPRDWLRRSLEGARDFAAWLDRFESVQARDYDLLEDQLLAASRAIANIQWNGRGFYADGVDRQTLIERRDQLRRDLEEFERLSGAELAAQLREELWPLVERYDAAKRDAGKLDFLDLLLVARDLVRSNREVRQYLQERYTHLFIDEFQDTDPLQAELLLLLTADDPACGDWLAVRPVPGKLFVVGDPKQSIYKFRRADVVLYEKIRANLEAQGVRVVKLGRSFRAVRAIQELVNAAFAPEMQAAPELGQARYTPLEEHWPTPPDQPCAIALPVPRPYGKRRVSKAAINESLPGAVVGFVHWLLTESGWQVRDPESPDRRVPIAPSHIAILFRRFLNYGSDLTRPYIRGFEALGIPHLLVGSKSYHNREEVETMRVALAAIEFPDDELSLFGALKGPFFAIPDGALFLFRHRHGRLHLFRSWPEELEPEFEPIREALELLGRLHRGRNYRPAAETINLLLEATRAYATFALRPAGQQVLANVSRVCDLARNFEMEGGHSFRGFVEELEKQAEKALGGEAPILEDGAEGVRLMTVHTAKGLEFPVVILADITANLAQRTPERFVDAETGLCASRLLRYAPLDLLEHEEIEHQRERAEGVRVAYVAATRARDLLVVPAVGDRVPDGAGGQTEFEGWVGPLSKAIYPHPETHRAQHVHAACPSFGPASVLVRPDDYSGEPESSVRPGLHRAREGGHEIVWWDPALLERPQDVSFGLRQKEILAEARETPSTSFHRFAAWEERRSRTVAEGSRPAWQPITASQGAAAPVAYALRVEVESTRRDPRRPAGPRFGTLVHAVLAAVPLDAGVESIEPAARFHGRIHGATEDEVQAAARAVIEALAHPLLKAARAAERCEREWPLLLQLEGGGVLEAVIDLAFFDGSTWTIVDFKTDADLDLRVTHYRDQVGWYCLALERLRGAPARGIVLAV